MAARHIYCFRFKWTRSLIMARGFRGMAAGVLAGCAASRVVDAVSQGPPIPPRPRQKGSSENDKSANGRTDSRGGEEEGQGEDATVKTAAAVSRKLFEHELTVEEKKIAGPAVHYAYGAMAGAVYGGMAELLPVTAAG